jgi:hypothetical protein
VKKTVYRKVEYAILLKDILGFPKAFALWLSEA